MQDFLTRLLQALSPNAAADPLRRSPTPRKFTAPGPMSLSSLLPKTVPPQPTVTTLQSNLVTPETKSGAMPPSPTRKPLLLG